MCGISGIWRFGGAPRASLEAEVLAMAQAIRHRGPDDEGVFVDERAGVAFGFRRLSILDLTPTGHQPMSTPDGRFTLEFNGEIYNFAELRAELEGAGVRLRGRSDTEVLLHCFARDGVDATLRRAAGMFALALWDAGERTLVLARDRLGKKPLYAGRFRSESGAGLLLFGSELKSLAAHRSFRRDLDRAALAAFFRFGYIPAPKAIFQGVRKLVPGTWVEIAADGTERAHTYWDPRASVSKESQSPRGVGDVELLDGLLARLRTAVRERMIADVPLGAFLSGGIDSSLVVALMRETGPVRTFTIGFNDEAFDEAPHARETARRLGTDHTELLLTAEMARAAIPELAGIWDEPFADSSQIPTLLVSRLARTHVTVALTGDGGDEVFGGYGRYHRGARIEGWLERVPAPLVIASAAVLSAVAPESTGLPRKARLLAMYARAQRERELYPMIMSRFRGSESIVIGAGERGTRPVVPPSASSRADRIARMMLADTETYLPDDILCKVDRASMAVSLETRAPLLDHRVVEFAAELPMTLRVGAAPGKRALRELLARYLPRGVFEREKRGFGVPVNDWLRGPLRAWGEDLLSETSLERGGILRSGAIRSAWREHLRGERDASAELWAALMFQSWRERWLPG